MSIPVFEKPKLIQEIVPVRKETAAYAVIEEINEIQL